jgi:hypothetical protein
MTEDYFWKNIFEDMAYGICPYGVSIHNGTLYSNIKEKKFSYSFMNKSDDDMFKTIMHHFKSKLNISTSGEYAAIRETLEQNLGISKYKTWKEIRKKNIRNILIINYVIRLSKQYQLKLAQTQKLINLFSLGFAFKIITNDDVVYDFTTQCVSEIHGISYDEIKKCKLSM